MTEPLMPMATGVWLVDNTSLSFTQIAAFCGLHELEVQGIADEQVDEVPAKARSGGAKYTPVSKRQDKPDAIAWLIRNHPELTDAQISKLVGTTKPTITAIRERTHWNMSNIKPVDPVLLGLCKQLELDAAVKKAAPRRAETEKANETE
jgi:hypothetical protein